MNMPPISIFFGMILGAMGVAGYWISRAPTALIPAGFGALLIICGIIAFNPARLKHSMHAAAMLGLIGFLMTVPSVVALPMLIAGRAVQRPLAVIMKSGMAIFCLLFVLLCVKSFMDVRRAKKLNTETKAN